MADTAHRFHFLCRFVLSFALVATGCGGLSPEDLVRRAHTALGAGDVAGAEAFLLDAVRRDPANVGAHLALGELYLRQARWEECGVHYRAVVRLRPFLAVAHLNLALVCIHEEDFRSAAEHLRQAEQHAQDDRTRGEVGVLKSVLEHAERLRGEILDVKTRLEETADDPALLLQLGDSWHAYAVLFDAVNMADRSEQSIREALAVTRRRADFWREEMTAGKEPERAALELGTALADLVWFCDRLAEATMAQEFRSACLAALDRVETATDALRAEAWYVRARMAVYADDLVGASDCAGRAIRLAGDRAKYHAALAEILFRQGCSPLQLLEPVRRAAALEPTRASFRLLLADLLAGTGDVEGARDAYRAALRHAILPRQVARARAGLDRLKQGQPPESVVQDGHTLGLFDRF